MKISARNQLAGRILSIQSGAVNGSVKVDIGKDIVFTANITEETIVDLGLGAGDDVIVLIKASDVLIGK